MKRRHRLAALLMSAALLLSACGQTDCIEVKDTTDISFSWWGKDVRHSYTVNALKQFIQLNPGISVQPEYCEFDAFQKRMDAEFAAHDECDVMQINYDWLYRYSPDGTGFYDLYNLADHIDLSNFTDKQLSYGVINGKLMGISNALNCETCYYDKGMYDKYGLELPETWDDIFHAAAVMSADGLYPLQLNRKASWMMCIAHQEQLSGRRCFNEDGSVGFAKSDFVQMIEFYQQLVDSKVTKFFNNVNSLDLVNGICAGMVCWISDAGSFCQPAVNDGRNIVVGDYIIEPGCAIMGWYAKPTSVYCIRRDTKYPEAAAALVDFLLNSSEMAKLQGTEKGIPLSKSMLEVLEADDMLHGLPTDANNKLLSNPQVKRVSPYLEIVSLVNSFETAVTRVLYDGWDPVNAADGLMQTAYLVAGK